MPFFADLPQPTLSRQECLYLYLRREKVSFAALARAMGISRARVHGLVRAERAPSKRVEQLAALGLPRDLLPLPEDLAPRPQTPRSAKTRRAIA